MGRLHSFIKTAFAAKLLFAVVAVGFFFVCGDSYADGMRAKISLNDQWFLQPAESPEVLPDGEQWLEWGYKNWRRINIGRLAKGKKWSDRTHDQVHRLWYRRDLNVPADAAGGRIYLDFRRIEGDAILFLNGKKLGELLRPGGEIEITSPAKPGQTNELLVYLTRDYYGMSRGFEEDPLRYHTRSKGGIRESKMSQWGFGITAPVMLICRPTPVAVQSVFVKPSWRRKELAVEIDMLGDGKAEPEARISVTDEKGKKALSFKGRITGDGTSELKSAWPNPVPWEIEAPYLYKMNVELLLNGKTVDHYGPVTFGFREIWTEGNTLMFNGHPQRFRLEWTACGNTSEGGLSMQRMIGRNTFYFQANPAKWWAVWSETPYYKDDLLDRMDRDGLAILMDAPSVNGVCGKLVNEPATQRDYRREMDLWFRRYRNHPSIVAWTIGMNSFNPRNALHAQTMGIRSEHTHIKARTIEKGYEIAKSLDPTRLVYSHADGNLGDIATGNLYLNFAQLQERMEWPSRWAKQGDMPYVAAEWGSPYTENFYKGKQLLFTEYAAAYFGPAAYEKETDEALNKKVLQNYPVYWDFQKLFVTRTERAWRTWGVQGWHNWNYHIGMGDPPGWKGKSVWNQYASLNQKLEDKPDWANPNWDIHAAVTQPLLVYIAGGETHTDLTHGYYAGEKIKKNVAVVWDGPGTNEMNCTLSLRDGDKVLWSEKKNTTLGAGEIKQVPFVIPAPGVSKRSEFTIVLKGSDKKGVTISDRFEVQVFPRADALEMPQGIVLWDTKGRTRADLDKAGIFVPEWKPDRSLAGVKLLLVGRETMKKGIKLPYTPADLARGLKVVVLEQLPEMWEGLGFSCIETMPRYTFATGKELMNGLAPEDLINWRGSPDLLPEKKNYRSHDAMHVRKWTNRHGVASTIMKIPDAAGFVPLVVADFDLSYSPLLEWRHGTGRVIFSSMDFSGRIGVDPAATRLFANLMKYAVTPVARTRKVYHTGGDKIAELLEVLGVSSAKYTGKVDPRASLVVCGPESKTDLSKFAAGGGRVVTIGVSKQELEMQGFSAEAEEVHRVGTDGMDAIKGLAPNLLRWRDKLNLALFSKDWQPEESNVICGGLMLRRKLGKGEIYFLQAAPWMLEERCKQGNKEREAVLLSIARLYQLAGLVMTQAGAEAGPEQAGRICSIKAGMSYETLGHWHVLGPFFGDPNDAGKALAEVFPGEKNAVAGDTNPNLTYTRADGQTLNFRKTVTARPDGFVDLAKAVGVTENAPIIYVTKRVNSDKARTARLRLGVDYWMKVWVNSEVVYLLDHSQKCAPRPNRHLVDVKLKKGENIFTIKVRSGSKGSGFWANLSTGEGAADDEEQEQVYSLYRNELKLRDPYEYSYW